jgi:hypothetical protein
MRGVLFTLLVTAAVAHANPRPLPFTYTTDTQAPGNAELELFADLMPLRAISPATTQETSYLASALQLELEIGLAERLELGLYATLAPALGDQLAGTTQIAGTGNGLKQRLRYTFADPGAWPVDTGLYVELAENEREIELEAKLLLHRRFDRVRVAANLSVEHEWYFSGQREWVLGPSAGITYELSPVYHVGLEGFVRGEYPRNPAPASRTFGLGPHAYVGPTVLIAYEKAWWAVGVYARLSAAEHDLVPGEPYGRIWLRSVVGFDL